LLEELGEKEIYIDDEKGDRISCKIKGKLGKL